MKPLLSVVRRDAAARRGLTLLELVVVLVILVGLAGILVPLLPSMLGRTETSTGATNQTEILKWVQMYEQLNFAYPRDWDTLVDAKSNAIITWVKGASDIVLDTGLSQAESDALTGAGIDRLQQMAETPPGGTDYNRTFNPYTDDDLVKNGLTVANKTQLVKLTLSGEQKLNLALNGTLDGGKFVVFGFGRRASIVGKTVTNAPVVFRDDGQKTPDLRYNRYGVVFQVSLSTDGVTFTPLQRARFVGVCNFTGGGLTVSDDDIKEFNNLNKGGA